MKEFEVETSAIETPYGDLVIRGSFKGTRQLVFFLGGAIKRDIKPPPVYQRATWLKDIPVSAIALSDETLMLDDEIELGWYLGGVNGCFLKKLLSGIYNIARREKTEFSDIVFFGSSGGGFASAFLSSYFRGSKCVIMNSQTDISRYNENVYNKFLSVTQYNKGSREHSLMELFESKRFIPNIKFFQNIGDDFHFRNHFLPFMDWYSKVKLTIPDVGLVNFIEYSMTGGHGGLYNQGDTQKIITDYLNDEILATPCKKFRLSSYKTRYLTIETFTKCVALNINSDAGKAKLALYYDGGVGEEMKSKLISLGWRESKMLGYFKYIFTTSAVATEYLDMEDLSDLPYLKLVNWSNEIVSVGINYE